MSLNHTETLDLSRVVGKKEARKIEEKALQIVTAKLGLIPSDINYSSVDGTIRVSVDYHH